MKGVAERRTRSDGTPQPLRVVPAPARSGALRPLVSSRYPVSGRGVLGEREQGYLLKNAGALALSNQQPPATRERRTAPTAAAWLPLQVVARDRAVSGETVPYEPPVSKTEAIAVSLRDRGVRGRPSHAWPSLSPTEREIVHLVGHGLTNKEIGDQLSISHRTVQGYLSRVFAKLGVRTRREIRTAVQNLTVPHQSGSRPFHGRASLSPTEREIVHLVGDGLTNREIGDRLFISHRTVHGHLWRVFRKLGVSSRQEIRMARSVAAGFPGAYSVSQGRWRRGQGQSSSGLPSK